MINLKKLPIKKSPLDLKKALASGGLVMGSPKKPPFGKKIIDDLFGSPERNEAQRAAGKALNEASSGPSKFKYGVQTKKTK